MLSSEVALLPSSFGPSEGGCVFSEERSAPSSVDCKAINTELFVFVDIPVDPILGPSVGRCDGNCDGSAEGMTVGKLLGRSVGSEDGEAEGVSLCPDVGNDDDSPDGLDVGNAFGVLGIVPKGRPGRDRTESSVGPLLGPSVGRYDGDCDVPSVETLLVRSVGNDDGEAEGVSLGCVRPTVGPEVG